MDKLLIKSAKSVGKIVLLCALLWFFIKFILFAFEGNLLQIYVGSFIFVFITLPTIFWIFFKNKFFGKYPKLSIVWKIYRVFYVILVAIWLGFWGFGEVRSLLAQRTQKTIDFINSKRITLADVMGQNLPPKPDLALNDLTIAGIDANNNYIRDDVELAIFEKYPNSAKIRSAMLQYAQAKQLELTKVTSSETLVPVMQKDDSAFFCLGFSGMDIDLVKIKLQEISELVLNIDVRAKKESDLYMKYMTGYTLPSGNGCDIDLSILPN